MRNLGPGWEKFGNATKTRPIAMDSDQEDEVPNVNFVPSLFFVKRGVAKANPDKVQAKTGKAG